MPGLDDLQLVKHSFRVELNKKTKRDFFIIEIGLIEKKVSTFEFN